MCIKLRLYVHQVICKAKLSLRKMFETFCELLLKSDCMSF